MKKLRFVANAWTAFDPETSASLHVTRAVDAGNELCWRWTVRVPFGSLSHDDGGLDYGKTSAGARKKARDAYALVCKRLAAVAG